MTTFFFSFRLSPLCFLCSMYCRFATKYFFTREPGFDIAGSLFVSSSVRLSARPFVCPLVRPSIHSSVRLSARPSVCPIVRPSVLSSVRLSARASVSPFVRPSVRLSARLFYQVWILLVLGRSNKKVRQRKNSRQTDKTRKKQRTKKILMAG